MKNKILTVLLASMMMTTITGCGGSDNSNTNVESNSKDSDILTLKDTITLDELMEMPANPESDFEGYIDEETGEYSVCEYVGDSVAMIIPETIDGAPVGKINFNTFWNNNGYYDIGNADAREDASVIKYVRLPDSMHTIESKAFSNCSKIEIFVFGKGMRVVEKDVFGGFVAIKELILNEGLEEFNVDSLWTDPAVMIYPESITKLNYFIGDEVRVKEGSYAHERAIELYGENLESKDQTFVVE